MTVPCDLLVRAGTLLTQDDARAVLTDAGLAVAGGLVLAVGPWAGVRDGHAAARTLDLSGCLVLPGLVNAHTHASMTLFRGFADDLPLMQWLQEHIWPVEMRLTRELVHLGALLACAEMIRSGTTCFLDGYLFEPEVGRAVDRAGMRALLGEGFFKFPSPQYPTAADAWAAIERVHQTYRDHPRIGTAVTPHAVYTTSPEALRESFAIAERHGCPWQIHLAESRAETELTLSLFGKRPVPYLSDLGLLSPRTVLHHCVDVTEEEIRLIADSGACVVHNPESNMKLGNGQAPVEALLAAGVRLGLGTDGAASNNNLNLFSEMRRAALLQKAATLDPTACPAQAALDLATRGGADCLGLPGLGRLAPGSAADLAALDLDAPHMAPLHSPVSQAVYAATGHEVVLTLCAGRVIYERGRFADIDYPALLAEIAGARAWVLKTAGRKDAHPALARTPRLTNPVRNTY